MTHPEPALNPSASLGVTRSRERPLSKRGQMQLGRANAYLVRAINAFLFIMQGVAGLLCALALFSSLTACGKNKIPVEIVGYNHMSDESIMGFSVNGASGPNISPEGGGGKFNCCISIPERWHPGMKARVTWAYGHGPAGSRPPPPPQEAEVDIPEYTPQNLGNVQVHFYPNHQIKVVVSKYSLGHPLYPLPRQDWAPWTLNEDWARNYYEDKAKGISR